MYGSSIPVLALNETKADPHYPNELLAVPGYQYQRLDRTCNGGGVSLYITDTPAYKLRDDIPIEDLELIYVEMQLPKSKPYFIISWYRPPDDSVGTFDKVGKVLSHLNKEEKETILLGDTNCDLEKSVGTTELHYSTKKWEHCFSILKAFFVRHSSEYEMSGSDQKVN